MRLIKLPLRIITLLSIGLFSANLPAAETGKETVVLAGGCFWGVEAVYEHLKGVDNAVSGYAGGTAETAEYEKVSGGKTSHAEAVKITYDPKLISLEEILKVYFNVAHNPTQLNYQGPDRGTQYRSAIFYKNEAQLKAAEDIIKQTDKNKIYPSPIVTKLEPLKEFYPAEAYHQNYAALNPRDRYIVVHDAPKVKSLKEKFPELYKEPKK